MPKERSKSKVIVQFTSVHYPDAVEIVANMAKAEERSLGQAAAILVRAAGFLRRQAAGAAGECRHCTTHSP
jgi:hypothetical protein